MASPIAAEPSSTRRLTRGVAESIFENSRILNVTRFGDSGRGQSGSVMAVALELDGQRFTALNGGPRFSFTEAISFHVSCATQDEVDYDWDKLSDVLARAR